ncbi:hypothetical protein VB773_06650 [Haloarculaceae archaeon H-GB2-1]|nr:hypothetical protein [Haloarculaceae archaeon H-GB11]MEA5407281.1 hypothetical protein [Haloarculaceae archaeon H-GB2-1]
MPDSDERHDERVDGGTRTRDDERATGDVDVDDLLADLEALATEVDSHAERQRVRQSIRLARRVDADDGVFDQYIRKYTRDDVAESFAGAVLFSIPLLVEDGVSAIAGHFLSATVAGFPCTTPETSRSCSSSSPASCTGRTSRTSRSTARCSGSFRDGWSASSSSPF